MVRIWLSKKYDAFPEVQNHRSRLHNIASFTFDETGQFYKTGYGIILGDNAYSPYYLLGLLDSPLLFQYLFSIGTSLRGGYARFWTQFIKQLPIRTINFDNPTEKAQHDTMVQLVERMLELQTKRTKARSAQDAASLDRQIGATDRQIDHLVYQLYDLSAEEIALVEAK